MREDILIVINDREPKKKALASSAVTALRLQKLSAAHISPSADLAKIISEREPQVIVLDYFLSEAGTAVDIIETVHPRERVIIWTDEPSIKVAVDAMRLGISDYVVMDDDGGTENIENSIFEVLKKQTHESGFSFPTVQKSREEYVFDSARSLQSLQLARKLASTEESLILIHGPQGSGRNTLARILHESKPSFGVLIEVDLDLREINMRNEIEELGKDHSRYGPQACIMFDHIEFQLSGLIEALSQFNWGPKDAQVILGTSCTETAKAVLRIFNPPIIELADIAERKEDIPALLHSCLDCSIPKNIEQTTVVDWIVSQDWPGCIRQLKSVWYESMMSSTEQKTQELILELANAKQRWEKYYLISAQEPSPLEALSVYLDSNQNIVTTAARLGTGINQVREALSQV